MKAKIAIVELEYFVLGETHSVEQLQHLPNAVITFDDDTYQECNTKVLYDACNVQQIGKTTRYNLIQNSFELYHFLQNKTIDFIANEDEIVQILSIE